MRLSSSTSGARVGRSVASTAPLTRALVPVADFTRLATSGGIFTSPPSWLTLACPTTGRTVQSSASTIITGLGANAWRARNVGGGRGLSLETARTNLNQGNSNDITGYSVFNTGVTATANAAADPASASAASSLAYNGLGVAGTFKFAQVVLGSPPNSTTYVMSSWVKLATGAPLFQFGMNQVIATSSIFTATPTWSRFDFASETALSGLTSTVTADLYQATGQNGSFTYDIYGVQIEQGAYPGSLIPTTTGTASRAADTLSTTAAVAPGGLLNMHVIFAPNFAPSEQVRDCPIIWWDASNQVYLRASDHAIVVISQGTTQTQSLTPTWTRDGAIDLSVHLSASGSLIVQIPGVGRATATVPPYQRFASATTAYILGTSAGAQECCDLRLLAFFAP